MKKLLGVLAAGLLVFGVAGQAKAAFSSGDIVEVVYQTTAAGGTTELATDLGSAATATVASINALNSSVNLSSYFSNLTGLEVAFFAGTVSPRQLWTSAAVGSTPTAQGTLLTAVTAINTVYTTYAGATAAVNSGTAVSVTSPISFANGYYNILDKNNPLLAGSLGGYVLPGTTEQALLNGSSTLESFMKLSTSNSPLFTLDATLTGGILTTTAQPNASPVPIPPSVLLFGSGLLGLVGIRRREIFKF